MLYHRRLFESYVERLRRVLDASVVGAVLLVVASNPVPAFAQDLSPTIERAAVTTRPIAGSVAGPIVTHSVAAPPLDGASPPPTVPVDPANAIVIKTLPPSPPMTSDRITRDQLGRWIVPLSWLDAARTAELDGSGEPIEISFNVPAGLRPAEFRATARCRR